MRGYQYHFAMMERRSPESHKSNPFPSPPGMDEKGADPTTLRAALDHIEVRLQALTSRLEARDLQDEEQTDLRRQLNDMRASRDAVSANLARLQARKSVRVALAVAARIAGIRRAAGRPLRLVGRVRRRLQSERLVQRRLRKERAHLNRTDGPTVSIVVPTHDGAHHLSRLLAALDDKTTYRSFEVIVVDNGSTDSTESVLGERRGYPLTAVRNERNETFSMSCNQGAAVASGSLLLFLNNDVAPINPGWLGALVDSVTTEPTCVAAGAVLVYPKSSGGDRYALTIQHRGIAFCWEDGGPRPVNLGKGESPVGLSLEPHAVAASTAACLLVAREAFEEVGGFDESYVFGWEDVDLCMKLRLHGGQILMSPAAVLFHEEFGTQTALGAERRRTHYLNNSQVFADRWSPQLRRLYFRDRIGGSGLWAADRRGVIGITVTDADRSAGYGDWYTAHELGEALGSHGWTIRYLQQKHDDWSEISEEDIIISLLPQFDFRKVPDGTFKIAWVRNWVDRWLSSPGFSEIDLVVASSRAFADQIEKRSLHQVAVIPLASNPDRFAPAQADLSLQCDYTFTGSTWGAPRPITEVLDVLPNEAFTIYGRGWDGEVAGRRYWRGHLDYDRLPALYSSAKIVLDDTVEPNRPALNSRVFDALAAGTLVISDNRQGSEEWFRGLLPTYSNRAELRALLDRYLSNDQERRALAAELQDMVRTRHTYDHRATQFLAAIDEHLGKPRIGIRISPPTWKEAERWGDTHFAIDIGRAIRDRGWVVDLAPRFRWDLQDRSGVDAVLHIRGRHVYPTKPGTVNAVWLISHPDDVTFDELQRYDLVCVASAPFAQRLRPDLTVPVIDLLQATDPDRFHPGDREIGLASDLLFVGNSRGHSRPVVQWSAEARHPLTIYGSGWERTVAEPYVRADHLDNPLVPAAYRSATIVLSDHWADMAAAGFISNRVFDAVAAGAIVLTDVVLGMSEVFGDGVVTYQDREGYLGAIERIRADLEEYRRRALDTSARIRREHTFARRSQELLRSLEPLLRGRVHIDGAAPRWREAQVSPEDGSWVSTV